ncbi:SAM-dependent methyltransferase [Microcoleus sp. ZQ-A2]|nr:N-6 DNA methylase [Microcoleus sp. FACHB-1]
MARVQELLSYVWSEFRRAGIADDLTIIEYVASLLLPDRELALLEDKAPRRPSQRLGSNLESLRQCLSDAADHPEVGGVATLFDRYVLFRLPRMLPGGRYPTPRHIVESMIRLVKVEPNHRLGDFACGSGGFLVHRPVADQPSDNLTIGIDISPEWAKLARANAALHGLASVVRIEARNALQAFGFDDELSETTFDRILMNPPFGEKIDEYLAARTLRRKVGSRSETALTALALQKLAEGGQAALLVPSGLLFSNSQGERELRRQLIEEYKLEAVVSLPKDALQPYSPLQTNLLLVRKNQPSQESYTWFFQVEQDGYPAGRGRDLTKEPSKPNDLTFVEGVLINSATNFDFQLPEQANSQVGIRRIFDGNNQLGIVCQGISAELISVDFYPQQTDVTSAFLLAEIEASTTKQRVCVRVPLNAGEPSLIENRVQLIQELYKPKPQAPDPGIRLLSQSVKAVAIAIPPESQTVGTNQARLLGVAIQTNTIQNPAYDLRPERYIGKQQESRSTDSPAKLLARIYDNQRKLSQHIDSLFGRLELPPIASQELPSRLVEIEPFGTLSKEQKEVWEQVGKETEPARSDDSEEYLTAVHFTPEKLSTISSEEVSDTTHLTLELLERMGVIVPVSIADPNTSEPVALYRRVTERDLWQLDSEESNWEEQSG